MPRSLPEFTDVGGRKFEIVIVPSLTRDGVPCLSRIYPTAKRILISEAVPASQRWRVLNLAKARLSSRSRPRPWSMPYAGLVS